MALSSHEIPQTESEVKKEQRRRGSFCELRDTENRFGETCGTLKLAEEPLKAHGINPKVFLRNVGCIVNLHKEFAAKLSDVISSITNATQLFPILPEFIDRIRKEHIEFVQGDKISRDRLCDLERNPSLMVDLKRLGNMHGRADAIGGVTRFPFDECLEIAFSWPIRRLQQYPMMIGQIIEYTPAVHPDYLNLQRAKKEMLAILSQADSIKQGQQVLAELELEKDTEQNMIQLKNDSSANECQQRTVVFCAVAKQEKVHHNSGTKTVTLVLCQNSCIVANNVNRTRNCGVKYKNTRVLQLKHVTAVAIEPQLDAPYRMTVGHQKNPLAILFDTKVEMDEFYKIFKETVAQSDHEMVKGFGMEKAHWVCDSKVSVCLLCVRTFTKIRRKHHCRSCGGVFCDLCCSQKALYAYDNNYTGRTCAQCFLVAIQAGKATGCRTKEVYHERLAIRELQPSAYLKDGSVYLYSGKLTYVSVRRYGFGGFKHLHLDCWVVLKDEGALHIYKASLDELAIETIPIRGNLVEKLPDRKHQSGFFVKSHRGESCFYCNDKEDLSTWMSVLHKAGGAVAVAPGIGNAAFSQESSLRD